MKLHSNVKVISVLAAMVATVGCAPNPPRPPGNYAPATPEMPPARHYAGGSLYQAAYAESYFTDRTAHRVGDLLIVTLEESTNATKKQDTTTKRDTSVDVDSATLFGRTATRNTLPLFDNSLTSKNEFAGEGESSQSNALSGSIAVTVSRVLPNGLLEVRGERWIGVNQGDEYIRLTGLVRPADISADNTVSSTRIANAQIAYGGRGLLADANRQGWMARFFNSVLWPF